MKTGAVCHSMGFLLLLVCVLVSAPRAWAEVIDKQKALDRQKFWDNRDWDWYKANIPFFECPDEEINTTYYYRWELLTKHLTYGSPNSGYTFTEFIDRPFWSGAYGAISCPAGLQLYEARWLLDKKIGEDFARYWHRTPDAQPRRYSTWIADATWALQQVHPDAEFIKSLLPDLVKNYEGWEKEHFVADAGLFWQHGMADGMETNINSRQTKDTFSGAPGYRPALNSYLWADALAIARVAELAGDVKIAADYRAKAAGIKEKMQKLCWDEKRQFYFHVFQKDEEANGHKVKALSKTYETGQFAGSEYGRELIGYIPWQFNLPDAGHEAAWKFLMQPDHFFAPFGPTVAERKDPLFQISKTCCVWSGQSWPYASAQTLKALANVLQNYKQEFVSREDYVKLLRIYALTHRKDGKPFIAEAAHPDTGSWDGHNSYNHSEHYFHSNFADLIITGLVGLKTRDDNVLEVDPLAPPSWDYFAVDDLPYRGHRVSILWDSTGERYGQGKGMHVIVDGDVVAGSEKFGAIKIELPPVPAPVVKPNDKKDGKGLPPKGRTTNGSLVNFAVNNDGGYYPRVSASYSSPKLPIHKIIDGNYWYHEHPPNRWTFEGSPNDYDWVLVDFGAARSISEVRLYFLDDTAAGGKVGPPQDYDLHYWNGREWKQIPEQDWWPERPAGHCANVVRFAPLEASRLRVAFMHRFGFRVGLSEIEAWGEAVLPVAPAPTPKDNLAHNPGGQEFPKASASHTSEYDKVERANDGVVNFNPEPKNRWTSYQSTHPTDWLEIDFGEAKKFARVELAIYDDRGGVQAPASYGVEYWDGKSWVVANGQAMSPAKPAGGQYNEVRFAPVTASKMRVVFTHSGNARSGVSEIFVWPR